MLTLKTKTDDLEQIILCLDKHPEGEVIPEDLDVPIVFETILVVFNKPANMVVHPLNLCNVVRLSIF